MVISLKITTPRAVISVNLDLQICLQVKIFVISIR